GRPRGGPAGRRGGEEEAGRAGDEARPARAGVAEVNRHLGGVRAGNQVRHAQEVEEALVTHPLPPRDDLLAHERDVGGRPADADDAELHEEERDLAEGRGGPHAPEGTPVATRPRVATPALGAAPSNVPRTPAGVPRGRSRGACRTRPPRRRASPA